MPDSRSAEGPGASTLASATRHLVLALGFTLTVIGVSGFFVTGFDDFGAPTGETLLGLGLNPLQNLVHLTAGLLGLVMSRLMSSALIYGYLVLLGYFAVFLYGLVAIDQPWDSLAINATGNILHAALATSGAVVVALGHAALADMAPVDERTWFRAPRRRRGEGVARI